MLRVAKILALLACLASLAGASTAAVGDTVSNLVAGVEASLEGAGLCC